MIVTAAATSSCVPMSAGDPVTRREGLSRGTMPSMRSSCTPYIALLVLGACRSVDAPPPPPVVLAPPSASAPIDAAVASTTLDAGPAEPPDSPSTVAYVADGTLLVVGRRTLLARAANGTTLRRRLAGDATVQHAEGARGVVISGDDLVELVATPSLAVLYHGAGTPTPSTPTAIVVDDGHAVVMQQGDAIVRFAIPTERQGTPIAGVTTVASGARVDVAYQTDNDGFAGTLFDAKSGAFIGPGFADRGSASYVPLSGVANDAAFVVKGDRLARIDLMTAKVTRQTAIGCGKDHVAGNPTPSAAGDLVLVTCDNDGIVLDGMLKVLRRIPRIMPGCDNGYSLGGLVLADNHTLLLSGCGGQAKIDLATGRFTCGDGAGIVGAPYELFPTQTMGPGGPVAGARGPVAPPGRATLPRCTKDQTNTVGHTGRFRMSYGAELTIESDGAKPIVLDASAPWAIAPDEKSIAYVNGEIVVVRALPGGEPIAELRLAGQ